MKNRLKNINFYLTSIDIGSSIDNLVNSGTFVIKDTTVNGYSLTNGNQIFYVIVDADQTLKREIFRITNVNISTKTLTFDRRISPNGKQTHTENALVQVNDFAELFNHISMHLDDAGYCETISGLNVKFYGGTFKYTSTNVTIADTTLEMLPNTTNYIVLNLTSGSVSVVQSLTGLNYYLFATAVTNGTDILSLTDNRANFVGFDTTNITPSVTVGSTTTLAPTASATVTNVGTSLAPILNFGIPKGLTGDIATAPEGEAQTVSDNVPAPAGSTTTKDDTQKWVKVTNADGSYTLYLADGNTHPSGLDAGVYTYDVDGNLLTQVVKSGTYNDTTHEITYSDSQVINGVSGNKSVPSGNIAYTSEPNTFNKPQTFEDSAAFKGLALFPYWVNTNNTTTFNATKGAKQKFNLTDASSHTLSFIGLRSGGNYVFTVVVSGGSCTLNKATTFTACDPITEMYTITSNGTTNFPLTLANGVHVFIAEAFSTAIHVSYIGMSVAA